MPLNTFLRNKLSGVKRGFETMATKRKGKKADKLRKKLVNTRKIKHLSDQARHDHLSARRKATRFLN